MKRTVARTRSGAGASQPLVPDLVEKPLDLANDCLRVSDPRKMVVTRKLDIPRSGDVLGCVTRVLHVDVPVTLAMNDERRDVYRRQECPRIDIDVHSLEIRRRGRTGTQPQPRRVPVAERIVPEHARSVVLEQLVAVIRRSPALLDLRDRSLCRLVAGRETPFSHPVPGEKRAVHDQRCRSLRVGRREKRGHRGAFGVPDYRCSRRPDRVEDGAYVVHPGLERGYARDSVG